MYHKSLLSSFISWLAFLLVSKPNIFLLDARSQSWKTETTFHYCWRVKSCCKLVWMESTFPCNSLIGYSLKWRCFLIGLGPQPTRRFYYRRVVKTGFPLRDFGQIPRVHRVATAAFWCTFSDEGKISPGWWGWGVHAHPLSSHLPSPVKLQCTLQLSGHTH